MNLLLASVLTFFLIHTVLWLFRAQIARLRGGAAQWRETCLIQLRTLVAPPRRGEARAEER